jgi:ribonuclease HI
MPKDFLITCDAALAMAPNKKDTIATVGIAVYKPSGKIVACKSMLLVDWGQKCTTKLELKALYLALQYARELGIEHAVIANDNQEAVRRMVRHVKTKPENITLEIRASVAGMKSLTVRRTHPGEESLPHRLAQATVVAYRGEIYKKESAAKKKQVEKAERQEQMEAADLAWIEEVAEVNSDNDKAPDDPATALSNNGDKENRSVII